MTNRYRNTDQSAAQALAHGPTAEAGTPAPASAESERQMAKFSVARDGCRHRYNGFRYDLMVDAVAYARLVRSRPAQPNVGGPFAQGSTNGGHHRRTTNAA